MSTALAHDLDYEIYEVPQAQEKYEIADTEEVLRIGRELINKHIEAFRALANA